ncbi:MAG: hypothetical protein K5873_02925 [Treponema sp.]|nr:hypothetical protein [Treponema sp.]
MKNTFSSTDYNGSSDNQSSSGSQVTATTDSWNFIGTSENKTSQSINFGGLEFAGSDVKKFEGTIKGASEKLSIVIGATGQGDLNESDGKTINADAAYARWKSTNATKGLVFKCDSVKIPDVCGNVKLTLVCYHNKATEQCVDIIAGKENKHTKFAKGSDTDTNTIEFTVNLTEKTPIYISMSEEIFFRTLTIEAVN